MTYAIISHGFNAHASRVPKEEGGNKAQKSLFLRLSLFLMTVKVSSSTDQVFCGTSLNRDMSDVFLVI